MQTLNTHGKWLQTKSVTHLFFLWQMPRKSKKLVWHPIKCSNLMFKSNANCRLSGLFSHKRETLDYFRSVLPPVLFLYFFYIFPPSKDRVMWDVLQTLPPSLYPFVSVPPLFLPCSQALHVQMQSAIVLFRSYDLPVVSRAQGGSLISTGTAAFTGSLSVLSIS